MKYKGENEMQISARNQLTGTIKSVQEGAVNASVVIETKTGDSITASITLEAVKELGLTVGKDAIAVIKASEVMIGIGELKLSARNQISCTVSEIKEGAVNAVVVLNTQGGDTITSTITIASCKELELSKGLSVKAVVKATSVMIAV